MGGSFHVEWESEEEWRVLLIRRKGDSFHMCIFWQAWRKGRALDAGSVSLARGSTSPKV
jgi:hypothetical protein